MRRIAMTGIRPTDLKVAKLHERIEKVLTRIEIGSLPSLTLASPSSINALPEHVGGLYFITHAEQGLLYIGKAYDLRRRFCFHERLKAAIALGGVTVSWLELPCELNILCEEIFIAERAPKWNKVIPMRSQQHRLNRMFKVMREMTEPFLDHVVQIKGARIGLFVIDWGHIARRPRVHLDGIPLHIVQPGKLVARRLG